MKRFLAFALIMSLISSLYCPCYAIEDMQNKQTKNQKIQKTEKIKPEKNKLNYINIDWWNSFNDEYLTEYLIKAVENNKDLKNATLTVDEFYQNIAMQRSAELPSIQAAFGPGYGKFMGKTSGGFILPILANYEIDIFGKNHNKTTSVRKVYEASILDEQSAYIMVASAVGTVYINIVRLDAIIDLQERITDLRKEIFEMMTLSNEEGIVSTSDLVKSNKAYIASISDLTELKKNRTKLLHQLAVLTGDSPNNIEEYKRIDYKELAFSGNVPEYVESDIITCRPDYKKAEKMMEKGGIDVRIARKELFPSLSLGGGVFFNNKQLGSLFSTSGMIWGLGGSAIQPLFMGGRLVANLKSKKIVYEKSLKNYEKTILVSMQEVNDSLVSINLDKEKLSKQKDMQILEEKDFKLSEAKYNEGIIAKLDLNQREENLLSTQKMVYDTEFACMIDLINYYKAVATKTT